MRILFVHHNSDLYGSSRSLLRLLQHLDRKKFSPFVVLAEDGPLRPLIETLGVPVVFQPTMSVITRPVFRSWQMVSFLLNLPRSVLHLRRIISEQRIDLVHTNSGIIVSSGLAAKMANVPHFWHIRDWFGEFKWIWKPYSRYILWSSSKIIAVSKAMAVQFPPSDKLVVINNGFSLNEFQVRKEELRETFRKQFGIAPNDLVVGCVGRIKLIRKGQEVIIQAAALLAQRGLFPKLVFVGAPYRGNEGHLEILKQMARESGLENQTHFIGEVKDTKPAYAAMDLFVLPSAQPEPFGGVVMEAMSMGLPVIATDIGGSVDQVVNGETGYLVPPNNPNALADKIEFLLRNPEDRKRFGNAGTNRIAQCFSLERMARELECLYCNR